jgi:hypothetical protein
MKKLCEYKLKDDRDKEGIQKRWQVTQENDFFQQSIGKMFLPH